VDIPGPSNLTVDLSFSTLECKPRKLSESKYVTNAVNSIDQLVPFCIEKSKTKKLTKPKKKEDIDSFIWDDLMSSMSRDSQYRYVPGFQNFPQVKNIPEHLMPDSIATNICFEDNITEKTIAPTLLYNLPDVGVPVSEPVPSQIDKPVPPPQSEPADLQRKAEPEPSLPPPTPPAPKSAHFRPEQYQPKLPVPAVQEKPISPLPIPAPSGVQSAPPPPPPPPMEPKQPTQPESQRGGNQRPEPAQETEDFFTQLRKKIEERNRQRRVEREEAAPQRQSPKPSQREGEDFHNQLLKKILERRESMIEDDAEESRRKKEDEAEWSS